MYIRRPLRASMGVIIQSMSGTPRSRFALAGSNAARFILVFSLLTVSVRAREIHGTRSLESTSAEGDRMQNAGPILGGPERSARKIQHSRGDLKSPTTTSTDSSNPPHDQSSALQGYLYRRTLDDRSDPGNRSPPVGGGRPGGSG